MRLNDVEENFMSPQLSVTQQSNDVCRDLTATVQLYNLCTGYLPIFHCIYTWFNLT